MTGGASLAWRFLIVREYNDLQRALIACDQRCLARDSVKGAIDGR